jgi:hypothetical protein
MDFKIGRTAGLLLRTAPFVVFRLFVYIGIVVAYIVVTAIGGGIGHIVTLGSDSDGTGIGAFIGFVVVAGVMYWIREYILYLVKAGHIAVLVEVMDGHELPGGKSQIGYAQKQVRDHFGETSLLFGIDQLVKGILNAITGAVMTISELLPIPGLDTLAGFVARVIKVSLNYVDEVILAYSLRMQAENPWAASRDALILYGQNYKQLLKNAVFLTVILWVLSVLVFVIVLAPALGLAAVLPGSSGIWAFLIAILFAWALKKALFEPFAMTALMQVYFKLIENQTPDPEWEARLSEVSDKFVELKDKAKSYVRAPEKNAPAVD